MSKRSIIHMLNPMKQNSPFDINMALDAGYDIIMPYNNVELKDTRCYFFPWPCWCKKDGYVYRWKRYWAGDGYA
jgi:hypothetical protein